MVTADLMVNSFNMKIAARIDKKLAVKAKAKQVVLKIMVIDRIDGVNKHRRITFSS